MAGGKSGSSSTAFTHSAIRGDLVGWFSGAEPHLWPRATLARHLERLDALVAGLGARLPQAACVDERSRAMVAVYPGGGTGYLRHCDNSRSASEGERCNGRRLTAILYLNDGWQLDDGGELRLFEPYDPAKAESTLNELREWVAAHRDAEESLVARELPKLRARLRSVSLEDSPPLCDVAPLSGRLLLFFADYRVPHQVLPAQARRRAITVCCCLDGTRRRACPMGPRTVDGSALLMLW